MLRAIHQRLLQVGESDAELKNAVLNLETLGNLRNLQHQIIKIKNTMPLHFDINDNPELRDLLYAKWDRTYNEGMEKGIEKGIEKSLLKTQMTIQEIADLYEVSLSKVIEVRDRLINLKMLKK